MRIIMQSKTEKTGTYILYNRDIGPKFRSFRNRAAALRMKILEVLRHKLIIICN